nr:hypothetical protein B0A51_13258 [Rachicladosporium sp. CCFEE 5018]
MPPISRLLAGAGSLACLAYAEIQIIKAGGNGDHDLEFHPDDIVAAVGSQVRFEWYPTNHSLASSTYDNVCEPDGKIFSGYFDPASGTMDKQTFVINITSTEPIWYYCTQEYYTHCQNGMVGVINPPTTSPQTLAAYKSASAAAKKIGDLPAAIGGTTVEATSSAMAPSASQSAMSSAGASGVVLTLQGLVLSALAMFVLL